MYAAITDTGECMMAWTLQELADAFLEEGVTLEKAYSDGNCEVYKLDKPLILEFKIEVVEKATPKVINKKV